MKRFFLRIILVTLVLLMAVLINLPAAVLARLGLEPAAIKAGLLALIVIGLMAYRALALVVLTFLIALGANLPEELAALWGIERDILFHALWALILIPLYLRWRRDTHLW